MESVPDPKLGALTPLGGFAGIPDVLKQLMWDPVAVSEAEPVNATEAALAQVIDDKLRVRSVASIPKFLHILQHAKTEADEALVLVVLRATATGTDAKLSAACTAAFEKCGGLKIAKKWLNEAVDWNYSDLLVLLLDVLKVLPVQLNSITEARINEPIVQLRKTAQEDKVRRAAQDLLKHWRGRFTEKEKEKEKAKVPAASPAASSSKAEMKEASSGSATTATTPKTAAEAAVGDAKPLKKRSIKRLERMPFGGSGASPASSSSSKSSELIGNLMQRKSVKDAAASKTKKAASDNKDSSSSESSSKQVSADGPSDKETKEELVMQLPTIQSFKAVTTTTSVSKKIRWADEEGKDLVKIKLIESWRDMIHYQPHDESSFKDAKLREHEAERQMMKSQKERDAFSLVMAHEWTTPAMVKLPEALVARREPVKTEEVEAQSARTRREMEFVVLDGEVPPLSPKEWTRTNEPHRGAPKEIPLLDVDSAAAAAAAAPPVSSYADPNETEEERALREALGPLQRSTIALLMENEHVLPIVYEEAQRNGNRIPDGRVVEIIEFHRRQAPPGQRFNGPPPGAGGMPMYDSGYNQYGAGYDYARQQYAPPPHQHMHPPQQSLKRKAPGGILADAPPPSKRLPKRGAAPCAYFRGPAGCHLGSSCQFSHDVTSGPPPGMGGGPDYGGPYGPPQGGRFGHQPPMGMRGGGGMRGMRR